MFDPSKRTACFETHSAKHLCFCRPAVPPSSCARAASWLVPSRAIQVPARAATSSDDVVQP
eukprot:6534895-Prymnesium_polylepis.1